MNSIEESVKSINPCKSVIQTNYVIVEAHGGELSVGLPSEKAETKEGEGTEFIIHLPGV